MPHVITWIEEPWLMQVDYSGVINNNDVDEVMAVCLEAADKNPINFIVNLTDSSGFHPSIVKTKLGMALLKHPNTRWFAYVGVRGIFRMGTQIFMRFVRFKMFDTVEEARTFLDKEIEHQKQEINDKSPSSAMS